MKELNRKIISAALAAVMLASGTAVPAAAAEVQAPALSAVDAEYIGGLARPQITAKKAGISAVRLRWKKVAKATGYKVFMKTAKGWKCKGVVKGGSNTSFRVEGLNSRTQYSFRVQAFKKSRGKTYYSKYSSPVTVTTKYGLGTRNFTSKQYSLRFDPKIWGAMDLDILVGLFSLENGDYPECAINMSVSYAELEDEQKGMTTDEYVQFVVENQEEGSLPMAIGDIRNIDGYDFRTITIDHSADKRTSDMEEIIYIMVKADASYSIYLGASKKYHSYMVKQTNKVIKSIDIM